MKYEPKKRWLEFIDKSNPKNKTKTIRVRNKFTDQSLGDIKWDCGWRCYVFDDGRLKMAEGCEFEVFEKLKELREERENLSTSHNTDYDSESNDSTPQGDIEQSSTSHNQ